MVAEHQILARELVQANAARADIAKKAAHAEKRALEAKEKEVTSATEVAMLKAKVASERARAEKLKAEVSCSQEDILRAIVERVLLSERFSKMASEIAAILNTSVQAEVIEEIANDYPDLDKSK